MKDRIDRLRIDSLKIKNLAEKEIKEQNEQLIAIFDKAMEEYDRKITKHLKRLENTNGGLTIDDLNSLLSPVERNKFEMDLEEYIQLGSSEYAKELHKELQNASDSFHINHYQYMQAEVQGIVGKLWKKVEGDTTKFFTNNYKGLYYQSVKMLQDYKGDYKTIAGVNEELLRRFLNEPWAPDKRKFTERLLNHSSTMTSQIYSEMAQIATGTKGIGKVAESVANIMDIGYGKATKIVYNETMYHLNDARKESYITEEVEKYKYVSTLDFRTTPHCRKLDGTVWKVSDYTPGFNAPPHPGGTCRSVTAPVTKWSKAVPRTRAARDKNGKTIYIDNNITYSEWKKRFVKD